MKFDPETLSSYPSDSGVYLMRDAAKNVLYVGKGKNLRARLKSYFFSHADTRPTLPHLLSQVESIDTIVTRTEKEALLLEHQLIQRYRPKYNILLKDDKSRIGLVLTPGKWPRVQLVRSKTSVKGKFFGPYPSTLAARQTFDLIVQLFPLRQCSDQEFARRTRPCLLYDIGRCIAPCVGKCTHEEYQHLVHQVERFLRGDVHEWVGELRAKMERAAEELAFEEAGRLLRLIRHIEHVAEKQWVDLPSEKECDVLALHREGESSLIALLLFREGKLMGVESFSFPPTAASDEEIIESFLLQYYANNSARKGGEKVLLSHEVSSRSSLEEILGVILLLPKRAREKGLVELGLKNAKALLEREEKDIALQEKLLLQLEQTLFLTRFPKIIECLDTSHFSGSDPVASLVAFVDGRKEKSRTRLFKVKSEGDDYAAMREVLLRHLGRQKKEDTFPDLLMLDGGKGHLQVALDVFQELDIASIDLIALTKEEGRHDKGMTRERVFLSYRKDPIIIEAHSPLLFLLQRIRDEAHRHALSYHQKRRAKRLLRSSLDDLPGIGPVKKRVLLTHFGSVARLEKATPEELEACPKLSQKDRQAILCWIRNLHG
ncbi:MAG: excinuclease ABC subunit UvrC [Verrucomicrobiota bacterium]|nr:excinuclease ABC subunit UvrC [Verrucomicrobiota bacterium]